MFTVCHNYFYCDYSLSCQLGQSDCGGVGVTVKNNYCSTKKGEPVEPVHKLTELRKLGNAVVRWQITGTALALRGSQI